MRTVWVTRAEPGATATAERLAALGYRPLVAPVLTVRDLTPEIDLDGVQALAFTSANGVRAFAALTPRRDLPVFAVGGATALAARGVGFSAVTDADGDVEALAAVIVEARPGGVLHPTAREAADLIGRLQAEGVEGRALAVYETVAAEPGPALSALDVLEAVLIHSPKAARRVDAVLPRAASETLFLAAISPAAAEPLRGRTWRSLRIAAAPTEAALLAVLGQA